ncbi:MAG: prenyltransferase [Chloroflexota bacterium]
MAERGLSRQLRWARLFIRLSRPHFLLGGALLYGLGAAIAHYLHYPLDGRLYALGQAMVSLIQLMAHYLNEYYDASDDLVNPQRNFLTGGSGALGPEGLPRRTALYAAIVCVTAAATVASVLLVHESVSLATWLLLVLSFLLAYFYGAPPVRLITSGYGELTTALLVAALVPAFAFSLLTGTLDRLLLLSSAPLVALNFAMLMAFTLNDYAADSRTGKRTLMIRLGWSTGMRLHDLAIALAVLAFAIGGFDGLPARVALGSLIALPLALAQVWQMARIRAGFKPQWRMLTVNAIGLFVLVAYLEIVGFLLAA